MRSSRWLRHLALAALVVLPLGCVDGPFARVNPHDPAAEITVQVRGADTVFTGESVLFQAVTNVPTTGYTVTWTSSDARFLQPQGLGRFATVSTLPAPVTVQVRAQLGPHVGTRDVVVAPAP